MDLIFNSRIILSILYLSDSKENTSPGFLYLPPRLFFVTRSSSCLDFLLSGVNSLPPMVANSKSIRISFELFLSNNKFDGVISLCTMLSRLRLSNITLQPLEIDSISEGNNLKDCSLFV